MIAQQKDWKEANLKINAAGPEELKLKQLLEEVGATQEPKYIREMAKEMELVRHSRLS